MDVRARLEAVADTYAKLSSFEVEILSTTESGDEYSFKRGSQRGRAYFVAPDKVRIDHSGTNGTITVTDGKDRHHYFRQMNRYSTSAVVPGPPIPGFFRTDYPLNTGLVFLFNQIAESVTDAEILREEPDAQIVSVTYAPAPRPGFIVSSSPITYWIDTRTNLISRMEGEVTIRAPRAAELLRTRTVCTYTNAFLNQTIPPQTFEYAPPADAIDGSDPRNRPGSTSGNHGRDEKKHFDSWRDSRWTEEAFVDQFELKTRGVELAFERRITFEDQIVIVSETIVGPHGPIKHEFSIKLA